MHGGDIYNKKIEYDFSMNVNPLGMPQSVRRAFLNSVDFLEQYPDIECNVLVEALSKRIGIKPEQIVIGNGASELIPAFFRAMNIKKAVLPIPCFSGYERSLKACGSEIIYLGLKEENDFEFTEVSLEDIKKLLNEEKPQAVVLVNPNNPNGKLLEKSVLKKLQKICEKKNILLFLDECFIELSDASYSFCEDKSSATFYLNAFTKSYAIPGLRLGYLVCPNVIFAEKIKNQLAEWNVSVPAQSAGLACIKETDYLENARKLIQAERLYLKLELEKLGFKVYPSDSNFLLFYSAKKEDLREELIKKEILIRDCSDYAGLKKGYYRVAVRQHSENQLLIESIKEILNAD